MSFGRPVTCAVCTTQPSVISCEGCQRRFCYACLNQHRNDLSLELDDLFNRRNELMEVIKNQVSSDPSSACSCLNDIYRWQSEMHTKIDRIATDARNAVENIVAETKGNVHKELDQISQELQRHQKTNGYVEGDLNRIKQQLIKLNLTVQQCNNQIRVDTSNSSNINWDALLFVVPNGQTSMNAVPAAMPSSLNLNNSFSRNLPHTMSLSRQQYPSYACTLPPTNSYRSNARSASVSMGSRPPTYTCIGCKTINIVQESGRSFCSVCRSPAPF